MNSTTSDRVPSRGFWRHCDGFLVFVLEVSDNFVRYEKHDGTVINESRRDFLGMINIGPVGDIIIGGADYNQVLVPKFKKVVGWHWQRHAGHTDHVSPKLEDWDR